MRAAVNHVSRGCGFPGEAGMEYFLKPLEFVELRNARSCRGARLSLPGIPWHIIQRGNNRAVCFHAEEDYQFYLHYLKEFAGKFDCAVHAYVLMTNHVHLLLTPARADSAGLLMKHLGQRYVQYINRAYRRSGTLWEGRFRSCLTQSEEYVLACYRYIELNPVRAGMVLKPEDYRWSSYHVNGLGKPNALIAPHDEYRRLGRTDQTGPIGRVMKQAAPAVYAGCSAYTNCMDCVTHNSVRWGESDVCVCVVRLVPSFVRVGRGRDDSCSREKNESDSLSWCGAC